MSTQKMDWAKIREVSQTLEEGAPDWPAGVRPISMDGLSLLGIGPDNRLYWDGRQIKVSRTVSLTGYQTLLATLTALGALAGGVAALLPFLGFRP